jgi:hypothetical protein
VQCGSFIAILEKQQEVIAAFYPGNISNVHPRGSLAQLCQTTRQFGGTHAHGLLSSTGHGLIRSP